MSIGDVAARQAPVARDAAEDCVLEAIAAGRDELVDLVTTLIGFDTTTRDGVGPARQERDLQEYVGKRLSAVGAEVDIWEPAAQSLDQSRQIPNELNWEGYPQLVGRVRGRSSTRSLLLSGHIDTVSPEPMGSWNSDPFVATVREGMLIGRGAADMKGGVAAMIYATEALRRCGIELGGDLLLNTVTDEESTSAGGVATLAHGVRADACIIAEPTALNLGIACRGSLLPSIHIRGQAGHAAAVQPHWRSLGAISAIEKAAPVLAAVVRLRETWRDEPEHQHPYLPAGTVVATTIAGGQWLVSYADACRIECHISYLPGQADENGYGTRVEEEFAAWLHRSTAGDPWLAAHPPQVTWSIDVPPAEISPDEPVVRAVQDALQYLGLHGRLFGCDFWHDGATYTRAGIPSLVFGPGHVSSAHTADEYVPIDHLVIAAQTLALAAIRFCRPG
ncbi:MAG: ArgE/DapE family deacylase [Actinomycetota bacterium]|nr:ArgE/DapE family deacylase [Actinomycetota bacterium]